MKLIAKRPVRLNGNQFYIGDEIPSELVANPQVLKAREVIEIIGGEEESIGKYQVEVSNGSDTSIIGLDEEELNEAVKIMQADADGAKTAISECESESVLIFVHALDSRKTVKAAAESRAEELATEEEPEEEPVDAESVEDADEAGVEEPEEETEGDA